MKTSKKFKSHFSVLNCCGQTECSFVVFCCFLCSCSLSVFSCVSVPWQHYQPTNGVNGVRVDKEKRPELSTGSYEILNSQKVTHLQFCLHVDDH